MCASAANIENLPNTNFVAPNMCASCKEREHPPQSPDPGEANQKHVEKWWFPLGREILSSTSSIVYLLGGGFKYFLFSSLFGEMIQFD